LVYQWFYSYLLLLHLFPGVTVNCFTYKLLLVSPSVVSEVCFFSFYKGAVFVKHFRFLVGIGDLNCLLHVILASFASCTSLGTWVCKFLHLDFFLLLKSSAWEECWP
jgi:hypothetical protein